MYSFCKYIFTFENNICVLNLFFKIYSFDLPYRCLCYTLSEIRLKSYYYKRLLFNSCSEILQKKNSKSAYFNLSSFLVQRSEKPFLFLIGYFPNR